MIAKITGRFFFSRPVIFASASADDQNPHTALRATLRIHWNASLAVRTLYHLVSMADPYYQHIYLLLLKIGSCGSGARITNVILAPCGHFRGFPASPRLARHRPSLLRLRFCPAVGPVLTTGPWVSRGLAWLMQHSAADSQSKLLLNPFMMIVPFLFGSSG